MSTLRVNTIQNAAGTADPTLSGTAKAWVNFNGTGTVAIRQGYNVSSITDNGVGDYTVNFTTALIDANYAPVCTATFDNFANAVVPSIGGRRDVTPTTTAFRLCVNLPSTLAATDGTYVYAAFFR